MIKTKLLYRLIIAFSFLLIASQQSIAQFVLYGMTTLGGISGDGTIFKCTPSGTFTTLVNFNDTNGAKPNGSLILAKDSNLYGMTTLGGTSGDGTIFKCTLSGSLTTLVSFDGANGHVPYGSLIQASDGNLYGMTSLGGTSDQGTLFKCTTSGTLTTLVNFSNTNGYSPHGSLIQARDSNLYGMTPGGGTSSDGTIFKCTLSGTLTTISNLDYTTGEEPWGSLVQASNGNLYGMTLMGGLSHTGAGTIFQCTTTGVVTVNDFDISNGANPYGSLIQANDSNLYGMTLYGGTADSGIIFRYTTTGVLTTLVNFTGVGGTDIGAFPTGSLIQASDGNLYGITTGLNVGDTTGYATIFKCSTSGGLTVLTKLYGDYNSVPNGCSLLAVPTAEMGIDNIKTASTVNVYPNPTNGNFTLSLSNVNAACNIEIYNILGERVYTELLPQTQANNTINLTGQPSGVYFYRVLSEDGNLVGSGKLVVER